MNFTPKFILLILVALVVVAITSNYLLITHFNDLTHHEDMLHERLGVINAQSIVNGLTEGKEEILKILLNSGAEVTSEIVEKLPTMEDFTSMYGPKQKIIGLETCENFRSNVSPQEAIIGPAGVYNTGTNLISQLLMKHCVMKERAEVYDQSHPSSNRDGSDEEGPVGVRTGMFNDVPWGKHGPILWRTDEDYRPEAFEINQVFPNTKYQNVFPIVMVKDPFSWMGSMCRQSYGALWLHSPQSCLNLNEEYDRLNALYNSNNPDRKVRKRIKSHKSMKFVSAPEKKTVEKKVGLTIEYQNDNNRWKRQVEYGDFVDLWNTFYRDYLNADFPHLIVRYEDLLLHADEVIPQICECVGGEVTNAENRVHIGKDSAKETRTFGKTDNLVESLIRYGSSELRTERHSKGDIVYAIENLGKDLMEIFHYEYPQIIEFEEEETFQIQNPGVGK